MSSIEKQTVELVGGICDGYIVSIPIDIELFFVSYSITGEYISEPKRKSECRTAHYKVFEEGKAKPYKIEDESI